jgi:hypothetical protein
VALTQLFFRTEGPSTSLTAKELAVLDGVHSLGPVGACCGDLQRKIKADCGGDEPRLATLYGLLSSLEQKGLIKQFDLALPQNGGRPRRMFQITPAGCDALAVGERIATHLNLGWAQTA